MNTASPAFLWELARAPIRLREVLDIAARVRPVTFVDLSPGATASTFVKHQLTAASDLVTFPILSPFRTDVSNFKHVIAAYRERRVQA